VDANKIVAPVKDQEPHLFSGCADYKAVIPFHTASLFATARIFPIP
jgi:hypothetical protein